MNELSVEKLKELTPDEAEAYAKGILTKAQVLKRAQNRRYHAKRGMTYGPINIEQVAKLKLKAAEPIQLTKKQRKAAYIKAWRARNRVKLAAKARAKYHAEKKTSPNLPDHVVKAAKGSLEYRVASLETRIKGRNLVQSIIGNLFRI